MKRTALVLITILTAAAAMADHHERMPNPKLRELDVMAGTFKCTGKAFATPMAPEHATSGEVTAKWDLNGNWLPVTYSEKKTSENPMPFTFSGFFGYDLEAKKFVVGGVDNMGGWAQGWSDGWNGDTIVFSGPWHMNGKTANSRDTFRKLPDGGLWHMGEIEMDGKWMKMGEETCLKK